MYFTIRKDAQDWFARIRKDTSNRSRPRFELEFDVFYFCFLTGIHWQRRKEMKTSDTTDIIDYYPGNYKNYGRLYVALFISSELRRLGIALNERTAVHEQIGKFVDSSSRNYLTDRGVREFNMYAHGGFDKLCEIFDEPPRSLELFVIQFWQAIRKADMEIEHSGDPVSA